MESAGLVFFAAGEGGVRPSWRLRWGMMVDDRRGGKIPSAEVGEKMEAMYVIN